MALGAGPNLLRRLRRASGMSQQFLADVSGVSVRTIRGLENGAIRHPRSSSLAELATGLQLSVDDADRLVRGWERGDQVPLPEMVAATGVEGFLAAQGIDGIAGVRTVSLTCHIVVAANRRIRAIDSLWVVRAVASGAQEYVYVDAWDPSMEVADIRLDGFRGCALGVRRQSHPVGIVAFTLRFPQPLAQGQPHVFGYHAEVDPRFADVSSRGRRLADSNGISHLWSDPLEALAMQVSFEGRRPAHVYAVEGAPRRRAGDDVELDSSRSALLVREGLPAGSYGLGWEW